MYQLIQFRTQTSFLGWIPSASSARRRRSWEQKVLLVTGSQGKGGDSEKAVSFLKGESISVEVASRTGIRGTCTTVVEEVARLQERKF